MHVALTLLQAAGWFILSYFLFGVAALMFMMLMDAADARRASDDHGYHASYVARLALWAFMVAVWPWLLREYFKVLVNDRAARPD